MQTQLGADYAAFEAALTQHTPVSIRINPRKNALDTSTLERVPWCADGFYLPERPSFTLDPLFQAGAYYVQEASSMLLAESSAKPLILTVHCGCSICARLQVERVRYWHRPYIRIV
jgi:16S rRNA C967 or C1407 C5-methylase (RsmB/RsmF family)